MLRKLFVFTLVIFLLAACAPELVPVPQNSPVPTHAVAPSVQPSLVPSNTSPPTNEPTSPPFISKETLMPVLPILTPQPGGKGLEAGNVFLDSVDILKMESFPPQFSLHLSGNLPTPCHQLRDQVQPPDKQNRIQVQIYSMVDPTVMCTQVLKPFESNIPLGSYPDGTYTVFVNGKQVGSFTSP